MNKPEKVKIQPVQKISCPKCGELMLKIYPWSNYKMPPNSIINPCVKCMNKNNKMNKLEKTDRNSFIIKMKQEHPEFSDQQIIDQAHALFGGSRKRQRVAQIWQRYMGQYDVKHIYQLTKKNEKE